jgi:hypothetical protein
VQAGTGYYCNDLMIETIAMIYIPSPPCTCERKELTANLTNQANKRRSKQKINITSITT